MNLHKFTGRMWARNHTPFIFKSFKMKFNGFLNKQQYLFPRIPNGYASRKIWHIGTKTRRAFFNDD